MTLWTGQWIDLMTAYGKGKSEEKGCDIIVFSICKICNEHGLSTAEEFVASQIVRHLEKEDIVTVKAAVSNADRSDEYLHHAFECSINDIENSITDSDAVETQYIKREYIRMLKSFLSEPEKLKDIYKCIREYYELKE